MPDYYHAPRAGDSAPSLCPLRVSYIIVSGDTRTLFGFWALPVALVAMTLHYINWPWNVPRGATAISGWWQPGRRRMLIGSALFLASLTPVWFCVGRSSRALRRSVHIRLVIASLLFYGCSADIAERSAAVDLSRPGRNLLSDRPGLGCGEAFLAGLDPEFHPAPSWAA